MWVSHFMYICLLRCEGEFYSPCLPKVPGTQWTPNACLFNERKKTKKIIRNIQRDVSDGEQITDHTEWRWRFSGAADSHTRRRERLLWERVSPSTVPTTSSNPETLARKYMTSPQKLQRTDHLLSEGITQNPISYASCPQVTPVSHLPDSLL